MRNLIIISALSLLSLSHINGQNIVINEFCSLNSTLLDEDKDSPDWLELYNTSTNVISLDGWALSDDKNALYKWIFPAITLNPQQTLLILASGKDRKEIVYYNTLINQGDEFSYAVGSASIPNDWKTLSFNASSWLKGLSGFGFGDNDDATSFPNGTLSVFVRKTFTIDNLSQIKELLLHVDYDDGFVAYLNGTEIARQNMGVANTPVLYNQAATKAIEPLIIYGKAPDLFPIDDFSGVLLEGTNVLCLQVHNFNSSSSDLTLIPFLTAGYQSPVTNASVPEVLQLSDKRMHTNFKIGADGEQIYLVSPQNLIVDKTDSIALPSNISIGRKPDGTGLWYYFDEPTPGLLNTTQSFDSISAQQILFSPIGGVYASSLTVTLTAQPGDVIYYTTDGKEPTQQSLKYSQPIQIAKSTSLRAKVFTTNSLSLSPSVQTYIIENREIDLPIVSLTTDPDNLFDWNYGIYEMGDNPGDYPYFGANFWMDWERPINIEYFDADGTKVFHSAGGTKIFGAWSRANDQKSMALYARNSYGSNSFDYPFFKERNLNKYHSLVLRNSGNDWSQTNLRDPLMTGLVNELDMERQAYQPTVVYINGEYWGILNLREKVNEDFLADHHLGVEANKLDMLEADGVAMEGSAEHYQAMMSYIASNDMTQSAVYEEVKTRMEVINYMDYQIAQIYVDNEDWPGNNIKFWRPQTDSGRWRWILFDTDFGFGIGYCTLGSAGYNNNTLAFALDPNGPGWPNPPWSTLLLRSLVKNETFKSEFINRFADRINYDFEPSRVNHLIDSLKGNIAAEIPYHIDRWNHIWNWENNINVLKNFATKRPSYMRSYINSQFSLGGAVTLTVDVSDKNQGYVQVSSLIIKTYPWTGTYFKNNPVQVTAMPLPGYEFERWEGMDSNSASVLLSIPTSGRSVKAIFKKSTKDYNDVVINEINYKSVAGNDCGDWVELYNTSNSTIDLSNWIFKDSEVSHSYKIPNGTKIGPKNYLVLFEDESKFRILYPNITNAIGSFYFGLGAMEDVLCLYDSQNHLIDSLLYMADEPWPKIEEDKGETLSLINPYKNNEPYYRWEPSDTNGTPGTQNNNFVEINETKTLQALLVSCYPNPFTQQTTVRWQCSKPEHITVELFDYKGAKLETLFEGDCPLGSFESVWKPNSRMASGLYFARITTGDGEMALLKLVKP